MEHFKSINGYLSRTAQTLWPTALVYCLIEPGKETWILERKGMDDLGLGEDFANAKQAIHALVRAEESRR